MRDQASGLRLLIAAKKLKSETGYTTSKLEALISAHGYTVEEYFKMLNAVENMGGDMRYICMICGKETKPEDGAKCPGVPDEMQVSRGLCGAVEDHLQDVKKRREPAEIKRREP